MHRTTNNDVSIYNLTAGRSIPDWLRGKQKKKEQQKYPELRKQVMLMQDFEMPTVCDRVQLTPDQQYILASGTYKPRVRCFNTDQRGMKFERCTDSHIVDMTLLTDDYSQFCLLREDRYVELHNKSGKHYAFRIPCFGRQMVYNPRSCDMYFMGASSQINRFNLYEGRFMKPMPTLASEVNCGTWSEDHNMLSVGTKEGTVEYWDSRVPTRVGGLDCAVPGFTGLDGAMSAVTTIQWKDELMLGVGSSTGQIMLYDIRSNKPVILKDHMYEYPIKKIHFHKDPKVVVSIDKRIMRVWNEDTAAKDLTSYLLEDKKTINDMCMIPNTGLIFVAAEDPKIHAYYIPALGPAPAWCAYIDSITEELTEETSTVYDGYKFVTRAELEKLGLDHLIGDTKKKGMLKPAFHGFYINSELFKMGKKEEEPLVLKDQKKKLAEEKIVAKSRINSTLLPAVNRDLFQSMENMEIAGNKAVLAGYPAFAELFENSDMEIDENHEEYSLVNPVVSKMKETKKKQKERKNKKEAEKAEGGVPSEEEDDSQSSDDDNVALKEELRKVHRQNNYQKRQKAKAEKREAAMKERMGIQEATTTTAKVVENGYSLLADKDDKMKRKMSKLTVEEIMALQKQEEDNDEMYGKSRESHVRQLTEGNLELTFNLDTGSKKKSNRRQLEDQQHRQDRNKVKRSAASLLGKPKYQKPY